MNSIPSLGCNPDVAVRVESKEKIADDVVSLLLGSDQDAELPPWSPGAHVDLELRPNLVRQYSLCGDPADRHWQIAVLLEKDGRGGSRYIHEEVGAGMRLRASHPRNNFVLCEASRYMFIAGGIGITPLLPMIADVQKRGIDWHLLYGGRTRSSMAFHRDLQVEYGDRVLIEPQDEVGLLDLPKFLDEFADGTLIYCCGPAPLLEAVGAACSNLPTGAVRMERFSALPTRSEQRDGFFEVELARSGAVIAVPPGQTVLQALEAAGVRPRSSCREGTCGTCETTVLAGVPDHRDAILTADERAANDTMFICVSRAQTTTIVLDI